MQALIRFAGILLWTCVFAYLAGCADIPGTAVPLATATPTSSVPPTPTQHDTPSRTATPLPTTPPVPSPTPLPDTLTLWTSEEGQTLQLVSALATEFSVQEKITVTVVAHSSDDLRVDVIAANLTGEPLPDLIWGNQDDLAELIIDEQLQPVDQFYQVQPDQFLPALLTGATRDGQLWGLPLAGQDSLLLLYNRALLSQPPDTTDELIVATRAFEGPDTYGIAAPWTEPRWLLAWLNGYGGSLTTSDGERPSLHTPQMVDALNLLLELQNAAPPDQQSYVESRAAFAAGQVAFMVDGAWSVPAYQSAAIAPDLGIAPMPVVPATGQRAASALRGIYLMAPASLSGTSLEQARSFATYLTTPAVQQRIAGTSGRLPALQAAMTDPAIQNDPVRAAAAAQAGAAAGIPPTRGARCALAAMQIWLDPLLVGEIDQQEAAEAMQQEAERCLAR